MYVKINWAYTFIIYVWLKKKIQQKKSIRLYKHESTLEFHYWNSTQ